VNTPCHGGLLVSRAEVKSRIPLDYNRPVRTRHNLQRIHEQYILPIRVCNHSWRARPAACEQIHLIMASLADGWVTGIRDVDSSHVGNSRA
jgi:hypothetical protein